MDDELTKKIQLRLAELPLDIKQAVESSDLDKKIQGIGVKFQLHLDQLGGLEDETLLVMLGFENSENFIDKLIKSMSLPRTQAEAIAAEINREIFTPIRESLKKISAPSQASQTPPPAQNTPAAIPPVPLAPHPHDLMLVEKTVTTPIKPATPAAPPPKPQNYPKDPYREPVEP